MMTKQSSFLKGDLISLQTLPCGSDENKHVFLDAEDVLVVIRNGLDHQMHGKTKDPKMISILATVADACCERNEQASANDFEDLTIFSGTSCSNQIDSSAAEEAKQ